MDTPSSIRITEVAPRDGLQNEPVMVETASKVRFIDLLSASGVDEIEITSFVSPRWIPQLADADEVAGAIHRIEGVVYSALVPNEQGLDRALRAGVGKVSVFAAASETFSQRNTNASIAETFRRFEPVLRGAGDEGVATRGYVSCAVACPYEGPIDPVLVRAVAERLLDLGVGEIDLADTIGIATPDDVVRLYEGLDGLLAPGQTTLHLHDTHGRARVSFERALALGVASFDSACSGLGGCPYAPGAPGNLATESLLEVCRRRGIDTRVDPVRLAEADRYIRGVVAPRS